MKTLFITLIATIALTNVAHARGWMWFHGDIGLSSPFSPSSFPANNAVTAAVPKRKAVTEQKAGAKGLSQDTNSRQPVVVSPRADQSDSQNGNAQKLEREN